VDTGLDQNEAELGVLVLAVTLKVLADSDSLVVDSLLVFELPKMSCPRCEIKVFMESQSPYLLDQHVQVLRKIRGEAYKDHSVSLNRTEAHEISHERMYV
jgi:hypothetical protein